MKKILPVLALACGALTLPQEADAREFADIYTDCGLGAMIAPNNDAVAAVTNVTWDLGTTAISSNASSPETCQGGEAESVALILRSYPELERDLANGEGEHLDALMSLVGVGAEQQTVVIESMRRDFASLVSADDYATSSRETKAAALYDLLYATI